MPRVAWAARVYRAASAPPRPRGLLSGRLWAVPPGNSETTLHGAGKSFVQFGAMHPYADVRPSLRAIGRDSFWSQVVWPSGPLAFLASHLSRRAALHPLEIAAALGDENRGSPLFAIRARYFAEATPRLKPSNGALFANDLDPPGQLGGFFHGQSARQSARQVAQAAPCPHVQW